MVFYPPPGSGHHFLGQFSFQILRHLNHGGPEWPNIKKTNNFLSFGWIDNAKDARSISPQNLRFHVCSVGILPAQVFYGIFRLFRAFSGLLRPFGTKKILFYGSLRLQRHHLLQKFAFLHHFGLICWLGSWPSFPCIWVWRVEWVEPLRTIWGTVGHRPKVVALPLPHQRPGAPPRLDIEDLGRGVHAGRTGGQAFY